MTPPGRGLASPGRGGTARRRRWTRRSVLVQTPSVSAKGAGREDHVGQRGRLGEEDVDDHEVIQALERVLAVLGGPGRRRRCFRRR